MSDKTNGQQIMAQTPTLEYRGANRGGNGKGAGSLWWLWLLLAIIIVLGAGAWLTVAHIRNAIATAAAGKKTPGPIPVVVATARRGNLNIYLNGLGTVTPLATVTLHTRVDGEIMKLYYKEGESVKAGAPLAEIDPRPYHAQLTQAQGQLMKDQANLKNAQADLVRYQTLFKQSLSVTEQQVMTQQALVDQDAGIVKTDEGQVEAAQLNLTYCHVTSPIDGRIGLRLVDEGNIVHASDAGGLLVITQLQPITVVFTLAQDYISRVVTRMNNGKPIEIDAWDSEMTKQLAAGTLLAIDNQVDVTTGTFRLKGLFSNEDSRLFPNEFVNARLLVDTARGVVLIPTQSVQTGPDSFFVYVVLSNDTVDLRTVKRGATEGDLTIITDGIQPDDVIVTDGVDKLQKGSSVSPKMEKAAARPSGASMPPSNPGAGMHSIASTTTQPAGPSSRPAPGAGLTTPAGAPTPDSSRGAQ